MVGSFGCGAAAVTSKANDGSIILLHTWRRTARELPRLLIEHLSRLIAKNKQFESPFITQFCSEITKSRDSDIIEQERVFIEELYKKEYSKKEK